MDNIIASYCHIETNHVNKEIDVTIAMITRVEVFISSYFFRARTWYPVYSSFFCVTRHISSSMDANFFPTFSQVFRPASGCEGYSLKNFTSSLIRKSGLSSAIQCPEKGTMPPRTSVARDFIESKAAVPKLYSPPRARTGISSLTLA